MRVAACHCYPIAPGLARLSFSIVGLFRQWWLRNDNIVGPSHELEVARATVRVVVERAIGTGDPKRRGMLASVIGYDDATAPLFIGLGQQRPGFAQTELC